MEQTILLVEDDDNIAAGIQNYLQNKNMVLHTVKAMVEAKEYLQKRLPSMLILDWNLPDGTGEELCTWVRGMWRDLPIIFLTVRGDHRDMLQGFEAGADDYIVKPFHLEVLYSRIRAVLRRAGNKGGALLVCGPVSLDKNSGKVYHEKQEVTISSAEYELLLLLLENKNHTLTREQILEAIWDRKGNFVNDNTLTVSMKRLREKLGNPPCIKTLRSLGYRMEDPE